MDSIALEIRAHLEEAKGEITVLQRQYEQRLLKKSVKLGLTNNSGHSLVERRKNLSNNCDRSEEDEIQNGLR